MSGENFAMNLKSSFCVLCCKLLSAANCCKLLSAACCCKLLSAARCCKLLSASYSTLLMKIIFFSISNSFYVPNADHPLHQKVYQDKLAKPFAGRRDAFMPEDEGVALIRKGMFAFFSERSGVFMAIEKTFLEHEKCGLVDIDYVKLADPFLAFKKNSPYKELIRVK